MLFYASSNVAFFVHQVQFSDIVVHIKIQMLVNYVGMITYFTHISFPIHAGTPFSGSLSIALGR